MSPKCVYGEHGMQGSFCPTAPEPGMPCEPEPSTKLDEADFASLLEREPTPEGRPQALDVAGAASDYVAVMVAKRGRDDALSGKSLFAKALADAETTNESMTVRIKSLEGVLVAIRLHAARAAHPYTDPAEAGAASRVIISLVSETLDPCKPWCTHGEPGHPGACEPVEQERDE